MGYPEFQDNRHEVVIDTKDREKVFRQIVLWGEASWWPRNCSMKFIRLGDATIQKGTMYRQKVLLPFAPIWLSRVSEIIENTSISRRYIEGLINGQETVSVIPHDDKLKVEYKLNYKIRGRINAIFWNICFRAMHDKNIKLILNSLKNHLEQ
ncbi:MAG: hypothetical protein ISS45_02180 [Candidatus Omnitrophica bacterium]|nr:hypothetical protein [Candidatus Omnitrophota bacterium]